MENTPEEVKRESIDLLKSGRLVHKHTVDVDSLRVDRDLELEWVEGPTRFRLERTERSGSHYRWVVEPCGSVLSVSASDGITSGRVSGSRHSQNSILSTVESEELDWDGKYEIETVVDVTDRPVELTSGIEAEGSGVVVECKVSFGTKNPDGYPVTRGMYLSSYRMSLEALVGRVAEGISNPYSVVRSMRWWGGKRKRSIGRGYRRLLDRLGVKDAPRHMKRQVSRERPERERGGRGHPRNREPKEKGNTCPDCGGSYWKEDLEDEEEEEGRAEIRSYYCPDCGSKVAESIVSYHGPEPTPTQQRR